MDEKLEVEAKIKALLEARGEFYKLFDENSVKFGQTDVFDFDSCGDLKFKEAYAKFYDYDYAIRKLLPYLYKAYGVKFNV